MRALVLSGGGSKGQFHVGWVKRRIGELQTAYDIFCGVSVGALVAAFLAQFSLGREKEAALQLEMLFTPISNRDVWKPWFFGKLAGLWKPSFLDSSPLAKLVHEHLDPKALMTSGKRLRVGAVSLSTGKYKAFDETFVPIHQAVLASASYPTMLLPAKIGNELWTDGGVRDVTPIKAAIDAGASSIDVVVAQPDHVEFAPKKRLTALDIAVRSLETMCNEIIENDISMALLYNRVLEEKEIPGKRKVAITVSRPRQNLNDDSLNFDSREATAMQLQGYEAAVQLELRK